jgi:hypothetical protein
MSETVYLVFGDLHGRILPAFRLATVFGREHGVRVAGILQVGDLGYFPDPGRLDKATRRHAAADALELGALLIAEPSTEADRVFASEDVPPGLWFTAGNHEDFDALESLAHGDAFPVDAYHRVWCVRDGRVTTLADGVRVGALWGIDNEAPVRRRNLLPSACIKPDSAVRLACSRFDVLLTHDSPRDAIVPNAGSQEIVEVIQAARPRFAFFGHHKGRGRRVEGDFGETQVYFLSGMELRQAGQHAEEGSVGCLRWEGNAATFAYLDPAWLRSFTRHNWLYR